MSCCTRNTFCSSVKCSFEKVKREIIRCSMRCFMLCIQTNSHLQNTISLRWPQNKTHLAAQIYCMLVVRKEPNTLSILHGLRVVLKTGQEKLYLPTDISVSLTAVCVTHTYFLVTFENLVQFF